MDLHHCRRGWASCNGAHTPPDDTRMCIAVVKPKRIDTKNKGERAKRERGEEKKKGRYRMTENNTYIERAQTYSWASSSVMYT